MRILEYMQFTESQRKGLYEMSKNQSSPLTEKEKVVFPQLKLYFDRKHLIITINRKYDSYMKAFYKVQELERYLEINRRSEYGTSKYNKKEEQLENAEKKYDKLDEELSNLVRDYKMTEDEFYESKLGGSQIYEEWVNY